jgi:hypothetical protein
MKHRKNKNKAYDTAHEYKTICQGNTHKKGHFFKSTKMFSEMRGAGRLVPQVLHCEILL